MVEIAIKEVVKFKTCNAEINLPQPSYTIHTLAYLSEKYPKYNFSIIMGADNLLSFNKWKNYTQILENYNVYIYPRSTYEKVLIPEYLLKYKEKIFFTNAPIIEISSSFIRNSIAEKKDVRFFLPEAVYEYIERQQFYKS
jgi:nicotinate-nucleotide adenylyltransferase